MDGGAGRREGKGRDEGTCSICLGVQAGALQKDLPPQTLLCPRKPCIRGRAALHGAVLSCIMPALGNSTKHYSAAWL